MLVSFTSVSFKMPRSFLPIIFAVVGALIFVILVSNLELVTFFIRVPQSYLASYHTYIEQLQWVTEYSNQTVRQWLATHQQSSGVAKRFVSFQDVLSERLTYRIYYDRKLIYHVTSSDGCRFKCSFLENVDGLGEGDAAVFSKDFDAPTVSKLKAF